MGAATPALRPTIPTSPLWLIAEKLDPEKSIVYAEQAVDADADNYQALVLLAKTYPNTTHVNDLDKTEKLAKVDKYSKQALTLLETATKPNPHLGDAEWKTVKNELAGQVYLGLGISAVFTNIDRRCQSRFRQGRHDGLGSDGSDPRGPLSPRS